MLVVDCRTPKNPVRLYYDDRRQGSEISPIHNISDPSRVALPIVNIREATRVNPRVKILNPGRPAGRESDPGPITTELAHMRNELPF